MDPYSIPRLLDGEGQRQGDGRYEELLEAEHRSPPRRRVHLPEGSTAQYYNDPVGFIRAELKVETLTDDQIWALEAIRDHRQVVIRSGHAAGKDFVIGHVAPWFVLARGGLVIITSSSQRQVEAINRGEFGRAYRNGNLPGDLYRGAWRLPGHDARGIIAFASNDPSRLSGFHAPKVMVIVSEGQGVPSFVYDALYGVATGEDDRFLVAGNPLSPSGPFHSRSTTYRGPQSRACWRAAFGGHEADRP